MGNGIIGKEGLYGRDPHFRNADVWIYDHICFHMAINSGYL